MTRGCGVAVAGGGLEMAGRVEGCDAAGWESSAGRCEGPEKGAGGEAVHCCWLLGRVQFSLVFWSCGLLHDSID